MAESITIAKLSGFGRGKEEVFEKSSISLGTDMSADVRFDPTWDKTVSPHHATIEKRSDGWWITDQSRDGSWVDGKRIKQEKIESGAVIELGKGGPRVKIEYGSTKPAPDRVSDAFQRTPAKGEASRSATPPPPVTTAPNGEHHFPDRPVSTARPHRVLSPSAAAALVVLGVAAVSALTWSIVRGTKGSPKPGAVTTITTPVPGATAEWQPVVDMGEEVFPSFIVASATMKESPFDTINDSPTRLGDHRGVVGVEIKNPASHMKVRVEIADNEIMRSSVYESELPTAGETYRVYPPPNYRFDALQKIRQTTSVSIAISVSLNGTSLGQKVKAVRVASINDCPFAVGIGGSEDKPEAVRMDWMFAAYVNENHPISDELRKEALKTGIVPAFMGYQGNAEAVYKQIFAIWYVLQRRGVRYSNITTTPGSSKEVYSQYVRFIDQSINNSQANCVDGSVLFASILRQIGIDPILVLVPGHMFVGFYVDPEGKQPDFLETTMIGQMPRNTDTPKESASFGKTPTAIKGMLEPATDTGAGDKDCLAAFIAALKAAREEYGQYFGDAGTAEKRSLYKSRTVRKEKANCQALSVAKAREMGVMPIGYQP